ncbi:MAG: hypothetical protein V4616_07040 [Bacteroidota bacterium]
MLNPNHLFPLNFKALVLLLGFGLTVFHGVSQVRNYSGVATDIKTGKVLFTAKFNEKRINGKLESMETQYFSADGKVKIAVRKVLFRNNPYAPNFVFQNLRTDATEVMTTEGTTAELHFKKNGDTKPVKKTITVPGVMVADAGLVSLILDRWGNLKAGKQEGLNIIVTSRLDYYHFILYEKSTDADRKAGHTRIIFVSDNWFVRKVIDPIEMVFENSTKRLIRFEGATNLTDQDGKQFTSAIITYQFEN